MGVDAAGEQVAGEATGRPLASLLAADAPVYDAGDEAGAAPTTRAAARRPRAGALARASSPAAGRSVPRRARRAIRSARPSPG